MLKPDPIEAILARLMPPAMSEAGQQSIETMLAELAAGVQPAAASAPAVKSWRRHWIIGGIAAGVVGALLIPLTRSSTAVSWAARAPDGAARSGIVLVGESDRVEAMTDEGWQEDSDGSPMLATRLSVVEENSLLDEQTGIVMQVSQPREEVFLLPVSTF